MGKKVHVSNLADSVTYDQVRELFEQAGEIVTVSILKDHSKRQAPGKYAIVDMIDDQTAQKAIDKLDGATLAGQKIKLSEAEPDVTRYTSPDVDPDTGEPTRR